MRPTRKHLRAAGCRRRVSLFGLAPRGVYPATPVARGAVRSYRTFSPLPAPKGFGGMFSVALSVGSRRPDVIWLSALRSPDFPPPHRRQRSSGRLPQHTLRAEPVPCKPLPPQPNSPYLPELSGMAWLRQSGSRYGKHSTAKDAKAAKRVNSTGAADPGHADRPDSFPHPQAWRRSPQPA